MLENRMKCSSQSLIYLKREFITLRIYKNVDIPDLHNEQTFIAIGTFDGVHRGHQEIFRRMVKESKSENFVTVALTFNPLPKEFFGKKNIRINSLELRADRIAKLGVNCLLELDFTQELSCLTYREFIEDILVKVLHAKKIFVGPDFTFGYKGLGNVSKLHQIGQEYGFTVETVEFIRYLGERISSTRIRNAILNGDIELAQKLLGASYGFEGKVSKDLTEEKGFILTPPSSFLLPGSGLYEASLIINDQNYNVFVNVLDKTIKFRSDLLYIKKDFTPADLSFRKRILTRTDVICNYDLRVR
jgi:riboflavin kinase/FMN adenylyltransferase